MDAIGDFSRSRCRVGICAFHAGSLAVVTGRSCSQLLTGKTNGNVLAAFREKFTSATRSPSNISDLTLAPVLPCYQASEEKHDRHAEFNFYKLT